MTGHSRAGSVRLLWFDAPWDHEPGPTGSIPIEEVSICSAGAVSQRLGRHRIGGRGRSTATLRVETECGVGKNIRPRRIGRDPCRLNRSPWLIGRIARVGMHLVTQHSTVAGTTCGWVFHVKRLLCAGAWNVVSLNMANSDAAGQDTDKRPNSTQRRFAGTDCRCLEWELVPLPRRHRCSHPVVATTSTVGLLGGLGATLASGEWNADSGLALYETRMGWVRWIRRTCRAWAICRAALRREHRSHCRSACGL